MSKEQRGRQIFREIYKDGLGGGDPNCIGASLKLLRKREFSKYIEIVTDGASTTSSTVPRTIWPRCSRTRSSSIRILDHVAKPGPFAILFHCGSLSVWLRRSSRNANLTRAGAAAQICERFFT
jgi:hypothetical protein